MHESSIYQGLIKNAFALILAKKQESRSQTLNSIIGRKQLGKRKAAGLGLGKLWSIRIYAHYRSPRAPPLKLGRKIEPFGPLSFPRRKVERPTSHESESSLAIQQPLRCSRCPIRIFHPLDMTKSRPHKNFVRTQSKRYSNTASLSRRWNR